MQTTTTTAAILINGQPMTLRITAVFQYRENYGAHAWDGKGICPQYWKNKGGHHVLLADGITPEMMNDKGFVDALMHQALIHQEYNDYVEYIFSHFDEDLTGSWTYDDIVNAYCDAHIDLEHDEHELEGCTHEECDTIYSQRGRYMDMAESMGYEA